MRWLLFVCLFLPSFARADSIPISVKSGSTGAAVSVTSSSAGVQVVSQINKQVNILLDAAATVDVWVFPTSGTCSSVLTTQKGFRLSASTSSKFPLGWQFTPSIDGWSGQICAILNSGSSAMTLNVTGW